MDENSKRKRVKQACDYCRSKKAKCDGVMPTCSACAATGETCIYTSSNKRRGLPTGYTHDLEKKIILFQSLISYLITKDTSVDQNIQNSLIKLLGDSEHKQDLISNCLSYQKVWSNSSISSLLNQFILEEGDQLHELKKVPSKDTNTSVKQSAKQQLNLNKTSNSTASTKEDEWQPVTLQYHGLSSLISGFTNKSIQLYNKNLPEAAVKPFNVSSIFNVRSSKIPSPPNEIFQFPLNARKLIDQYFQIIHPLFPMLNRISIIRYINKALDKTLDITENPDVNFISLIWSILSISKTFSNGLKNTHNKELSIIYSRNSTLSLENSQNSTIETIQSMILLGYYHYISGEWDHSWVLVSSATRMAIDVKLMKKFEDDDLSTFVTRERTWATVYILNTLLSSRMGRSPLVRALDWPIPIISEDGWEEWESWKETEREPQSNSGNNSQLLELESGRCLSIHNNLLSIISILNLAITSTIDINSNPITSNEKINLSVFEKKLNAWYTNLPSYCHLRNEILKDNTASSKNPPFVIFLHLIYNLTWCILAIRLSGLNSSKDSNLILIRDKNYTSSIINIYNILKCSHDSLNLPFLDYFISMGNFFPKMIDNDINDDAFLKDNLLAKYLNLLKDNCDSMPCKITFDLYNIMKSQDNKNELIQLNSISLPIPDLPPPLSMAIPVATHTPSVPLIPNIPIQSAHDELDLFMLDTDFSKNDSRLDQFMKNLGYVGSLNFNEYPLSSSNSSTNLNNGFGNANSNGNGVSTSNNNGEDFLNNNSMMNEFENIGIHEYLQSLTKDKK